MGISPQEKAIISLIIQHTAKCWHKTQNTGNADNLHVFFLKQASAWKKKTVHNHSAKTDQSLYIPCYINSMGKKPWKIENPTIRESLYCTGKRK